jgi:hypothetical protein
MQKTAQEAYPLRQPSDIAEVLMHALTDPTGPSSSAWRPKWLRRATLCAAG